MYVIGTAGHVDHGKSALVRALTGIDPDRLREEKERGLTIDLGFAWLTLPDGAEVGIVDVPGHERFIKNMLAGVGGIDLALLVVAADESVMPQTREHLAIIDLLDIRHGVVAVTKSDLVDQEFAELVAADVEKTVRGTTLDGAPIVRCSAVTRDGLDALIETLQSQLARTPARKDIGRPRLPIDRAFTISGFGTVVTGTLASGSLKIGQEVEVLPGGRRARIRGLQMHGRKVEMAAPGQRTAVNLSGVALEELVRGMVVATPGWLRPAGVLDVRLRAVTYRRRPVRHNMMVTFHTGAAEVEARLVLLDREELPPGETGWAQLRLASPIAALAGDRFVIRDPNDTLGGGRIVDGDPRRHRRFHQPTIDRLEALESLSPREAVLLAVRRSEPAPLKEIEIALDMSANQVLAAAVEGIASGELVSLDGDTLDPESILITAAGLEELADRAASVLGEYHRRFPLRPGMPREELRSRLALPARAFDQVASLWTRRRTVVESGGSIAIAEHKPQPDGEQRRRSDELLTALKAQPFSPPAVSGNDELIAYLVREGRIVRVDDGIVFDADAYRRMVDGIRAHLSEHEAVTLAQVRDMFGTSRKYAQALLEHMDRQHITRRVGDARVLRASTGR